VENAFDQIDVFEQQAEVGGVWNYTSNIAGRTPVPQTSPHCAPEPPIWPDGAAAPLFSNPMYDHLNTNIPKGLMQYSGRDFLPDSLLFPSRQDVQAYLVESSKDLRHLINFSTQVEDVRKSGDHWELTSRSTITKEERKHEYDAIVVANGKLDFFSFRLHRMI
jgi:cation diffusion facilitator CzcD-associated flavoprotein CzcO